MPAEPGEQFWSEVFGRPGPVEIEIGPGCGTFLLHAARGNPAKNYVGIESSRSRATRLEAKVRRLELSNVIVLHAVAQCVIRDFVPPASVTAFHWYFPDPWWKRRHHRRRLFNEEFVRDLSRALLPGGRLFVATDVPLVAEAIRRACCACAELRENHLQLPVRTVATRFERKARARGVPIYDFVFEKAAQCEAGGSPPLLSRTVSVTQTTTDAHS